MTRPLYFDEIKGFIDKPFIKITTGLRRSGKSEFLKIIRNNIAAEVSADHIIYINFEDTDFSELVSADDILRWLKMLGGAPPIKDD